MNNKKKNKTNKKNNNKREIITKNPINLKRISLWPTKINPTP